MDWESVRLQRVLDTNERFKSAVFLVTMRSDGQREPVETLILAEKTAFAEDGAKALVSLLHRPQIKLVEDNDIYYRFVRQGNDGEPEAKLQVIHPATPKHIAKYSRQERFLVRETPEDYDRLVRPYIESHPAERLAWVQNILLEQSEVESTLYHDRDPLDGFFLLPDSKWDRKNLSGLYLLVIVKDARIRSLRDIGGKHLGLLRNIRDTVRRVVPQRFPGIRPEQLRLFIHYQPTYYHFHVHVVHLDQVDGVGALVGQAHLLEDVIDNLESFGPDYYQRRTLYYQLGAGHPLYKLLTE